MQFKCYLGVDMRADFLVLLKVYIGKENKSKKIRIKLKVNK